MVGLNKTRSRLLRHLNDLLSRADLRLERTTRSRSLLDFLRSRQVDTVFDVGANQGQFGLALREGGFCGSIKSFEPLAGAYQALLSVSAKHPSWEAFHLGLGAENGIADLNVSTYSVFSSLKRLNPEALTFSRKSEVLRTENVRIATLDDVAARDSGRLFLKVDTQGSEQDVLKGAEKSLEKFLGVQLELPIRHLYDNVWKIEETIAYMRDRGFVISNIIPTNFGTEDPVSLVEVDCIFRNERPFR